MNLRFATAAQQHGTSAVPRGPNGLHQPAASYAQAQDIFGGPLTSNPSSILTLPLPDAFNRFAPSLLSLHPYEEHQLNKRLKTSTMETPLLALVPHAPHGVVPSTSDLEPQPASTEQLEVRLAKLSNLKDFETKRLRNMKLEIFKSKQTIGKIASDIACVKVFASPSLIHDENILDDLLGENEDFSKLPFPDATKDLSATLPPPPIPTSATSTISLDHPDPLSTPRSPSSGRAMDVSL